ncbi:MAG: glycosyltransferase family 1 protein, partial [Chloroflexia bacterium]
MSSRVVVLTSVHSLFDGRIFHRQCRTLAAAGHQVTLIAPADFAHQERDGITLLGVRRPARRL